MTPETTVLAQATGTANNYHNNPTKPANLHQYNHIARAIKAPTQGRVTYTQKSPREW